MGRNRSHVEVPYALKHYFALGATYNLRLGRNVYFWECQMCGVKVRPADGMAHVSEHEHAESVTRRLLGDRWLNDAPNFGAPWPRPEPGGRHMTKRIRHVTVYCIRCRRAAMSWGGYVLGRRREIILAGWCKRCAVRDGTCYHGEYQAWMGKADVDTP